MRLLSIGEEPEKGNQLTLEAHALLAASDLDFRGNAEGRDVLEGAADVLVTDGFTGNVALKTVEGTIRTVLDALREEITASRPGSSAACSSARRRGGCASGSTPTPTAAPTSSACAGSS